MVHGGLRVPGPPKRPVATGRAFKTVADRVRWSASRPTGPRTQTSPRLYPGSCSQREPKGPKGDEDTSANLRRGVYGALAPVSIWKGLITQRSLVRIQPPQPRK